MTALAIDRQTEGYGLAPIPARLSAGAAASTTLYKGGLVAINASGYAVPASADPRLRVVGVAEAKVDNSTGAAAAKTVQIQTGAFWFGNSSSTDAIAITEIGQVCYVADDQTVAKTIGAGVRPIAGVVLGVDTTLGVCVLVGATSHIPGRVMTVVRALAYNDSFLGVAATSATTDITGTLPAGAVILGYDIDVTADWTDGSTGTFALGLGDGSTATLYASDAGNLDGGAARASAAICKYNATAVKVVATVSSSVNLNTLSGGTASLRLFYTLP